MKVLWKLKKSLTKNIFYLKFYFWSTNDFLYVDSEPKIENKRYKNVLIDSEGLKFFWVKKKCVVILFLFGRLE